MWPVTNIRESWMDENIKTEWNPKNKFYLFKCMSYVTSYQHQRIMNVFLNYWYFIVHFIVNLFIVDILGQRGSTNKKKFGYPGTRTPLQTMQNCLRKVKLVLRKCGLILVWYFVCELKGIVHFEIKIWYLSAYPKGIQDVGVFFSSVDPILMFLGQTF